MFKTRDPSIATNLLYMKKLYNKEKLIKKNSNKKFSFKSSIKTFWGRYYLFNFFRWVMLEN